MAGVNKVILICRTTRDVELRQTANGTSVASVSAATNETYKDKNGVKKEETEWHSLVFWGTQANIAHQYVKKGDLIYLEGKIKTRSWDDNSGNKRYTTEINVSNFQMLSSSKKNDNNGSRSQEYQEPPKPPEIYEDEELPF
ncbi:MAG TPA: single-stranded DNA-binding protein [Candidatus Paceibacterota bacterium]|nr:single-stranded DNA-binding protein [Candidatus Paceibacterota bacterium]